MHRVARPQSVSAWGWYRDEIVQMTARSQSLKAFVQVISVCHNIIQGSIHDLLLAGVHLEIVTRIR
ncbi:hypothetical protein MPC4_60063 [Methylocella tundrae]|uniref:Transposase n=1 Tax=Methylocella tundrae TaxID=227605 RepID=A0A8B6MAM6_METTU|nr:hypothetical protein MPC1_2060001 [Methylocella tundrae]VTZ51974.1 hypothetical protein MPC4_60063 [Methylocella tundrae]